MGLPPKRALTVVITDAKSTPPAGGGRQKKIIPDTTQHTTQPPHAAGPHPHPHVCRMQLWAGASFIGLLGSWQLPVGSWWVVARAPYCPAPLPLPPAPLRCFVSSFARRRWRPLAWPRPCRVPRPPCRGGGAACEGPPPVHLKGLQLIHPPAGPPPIRSSSSSTLTSGAHSFKRSPSTSAPTATTALRFCAARSSSTSLDSGPTRTGARVGQAGGRPAQ